MKTQIDLREWALPSGELLLQPELVERYSEINEDATVRELFSWFFAGAAKLAPHHVEINYDPSKEVKFRVGVTTTARSVRDTIERIEVSGLWFLKEIKTSSGWKTFAFFEKDSDAFAFKMAA